METTDEKWRAEGLRWGILAGGLIVTAFAAAYFMNREWVLSRGLWLGTGLIYLLAMWRAQSTVDSEDLKDLIRPGFLVFVVANALFYLYYHLLFASFDPDLVKLQAQLLEAGGEDPGKAMLPTLGSSFFAYIQSLIFGFAAAGGIAFLMRQRRWKMR